MFENFPKTRPLLPPEIQKIYAEHYKSNRSGKTTAASLSQRMEAWLHRKVAQDLENLQSQTTTLEIGAGTLNQLQYEKESGPYDIIEPFKSLYEDSVYLKRVRQIYADIKDIPPHQHYDRITSVATFEHILNLPEVVARSGLLLKENGTLRVSIPSEGTFLWKLGWKMTTGLEFRLRYGLNYGILMRHEHVNSAGEIEKILSYFYCKIKCHVFGVNKSCSLYQFYQCQEPHIQRCKDYLAEIK